MCSIRCDIDSVSSQIVRETEPAELMLASPAYNRTWVSTLPANFQPAGLLTGHMVTTAILLNSRRTLCASLRDLVHLRSGQRLLLPSFFYPVDSILVLLAGLAFVHWYLTFGAVSVLTHLACEDMPAEHSRTELACG